MGIERFLAIIGLLTLCALAGYLGYIISTLVH